MAMLPKAGTCHEMFSLPEVEDDKKDVLYEFSFNFQVFYPNSCSLLHPSKSSVRLAYLKLGSCCTTLSVL